MHVDSRRHSGTLGAVSGAAIGIVRASPVAMFAAISGIQWFSLAFSYIGMSSTNKEVIVVLFCLFVNIQTIASNVVLIFLGQALENSSTTPGMARETSARRTRSWPVVLRAV